MARTKLFSLSLRRFGFAFPSALLLVGPCFAQAVVSLAYFNGPPTSKVNVSGRGFAPSASVGIYFDTTQLTTVPADGSGAFANVRIQVPASALPGQHEISGQQASSGDHAQAAFQVNTNWSQFHFNSEHTGLNPFENILSQGNVASLSLHCNYAAGAGVKSSPAVANGVIYAPSDTTLYALDAATCARLWEHAPKGGLVSSPAVGNGVLYVGTASNVQALDARTGGVLWTYPTGAVTGSPAIANGVVYVGTKFYVYALTAAGTLLWRYNTSGAAAFSPVVDGTTLYDADGQSLFALNAQTGVLAWSIAGDWNGSPALRKAVLYAGDAGGVVHAIDASSGANLWSFTTGGPIRSTPAIANGLVYVISDDGNVYALKVGSGNRQWKFSVAVGDATASPVVANGLVYVPTNGRLFALSASQGATLWSVTGGFYYSSPAVANGMVFVGDSFGEIFAFALPSGDLNK